jgi:adenosine deaminase
MLADLHLHFEGSVPRETLVAIAARNHHAFGSGEAFERVLARARQSRSFLRLFADCCRLYSSPADYREAAVALGKNLARELAHAEIYVSPEIWSRFGLDPAAVLGAIDSGLGEAEAESGARFLLLLDSVRQWGPDAAERVLDLHEKTKLPRVAGFGIGGEEDSVPAAAFRPAYERAVASAWAPRSTPASGRGGFRGRGARRASLDRIDHGIRAAGIRGHGAPGVVGPDAVRGPVLEPLDERIQGLGDVPRAPYRRGRVRLSLRRRPDDLLDVDRSGVRPRRPRAGHFGDGARRLRQAAWKARFGAR